MKLSVKPFVFYSSYDQKYLIFFSLFILSEVWHFNAKSWCFRNELGRARVFTRYNPLKIYNWV